MVQQDTQEGNTIMDEDILKDSWMPETPISKKIKERHKVKNIDWLDTAQLGQIRITASDEKLLIKGYSTVNRHVWYRKLFGDNLNTE